MSSDRSQLMDKQLDQDLVKQGLKNSQRKNKWDDNGQLKQEYLQTLTQNDLDEGTTRLMQNLLTQDYILSNIQPAEQTELKWMIRTEAKRIIALHPPKRSLFTGKRRQAMYETDEALEPLTEYKRSLVWQAVKAIILRAARSREGWQQQELSSQYNVSKVDKADDDSTSRLGGLF